MSNEKLTRREGELITVGTFKDFGIKEDEKGIPQITNLNTGHYINFHTLFNDVFYDHEKIRFILGCYYKTVHPERDQMVDIDLLNTNTILVKEAVFNILKDIIYLADAMPDHCWHHTLYYKLTKLWWVIYKSNCISSLMRAFVYCEYVPVEINIEDFNFNVCGGFPQNFEMVEKHPLAWKFVKEIEDGSGKKELDIDTLIEAYESQPFRYFEFFAFLDLIDTNRWENLNPLITFIYTINTYPESLTGAVDKFNTASDDIQDTNWDITIPVYMAKVIEQLVAEADKNMMVVKDNDHSAKEMLQVLNEKFKIMVPYNFSYEIERVPNPPENINVQNFELIPTPGSAPKMDILVINIINIRRNKRRYKKSSSKVITKTYKKSWLFSGCIPVSTIEAVPSFDEAKNTLSLDVKIKYDKREE